MPNKLKTQGIGVKLVNFIKKTDAFGTPVSFTYKNETNIKSFVGGFFTCLARLGVAVYLFIMCGNVLNRENIVQTTMLKRDLTIDSTENAYTLDNFDYGLRLEYIFYETQPEIQENLDQYVYLQITQNTYTWVKDANGNTVFHKIKVRTELGSCTDGRLNLSQNSKDYLGLKSGYQCPQTVDYRMKGSFAGEQTKFIQVRVGYCNQTDLNVKYPGGNKKCKSMAEMLYVAANLKLYYVVQNSYFDTTDFSDNPIKKYLKPYYLTSKNYTSIYYYMLLSDNQANYNDGMLFGTATKKHFVETRIDYQVTQEIPTSESTPNAFLSIYIQMDDSHKIISRQVTTFVDALQATGGFMTVIFVVTTIVVNRFSKTIYYTSLIKSFYKYQKPKKKDGEEIIDDSDEDIKKINDEKMDTLAMKFSQDKFKAEKEKIYFRLLEQICDRKKLIMGLNQAIINKIKSLFCRKLTKKQYFMDLLFKRGITKIEKELDIRTVAKQLKTLKFISQVMLTKYQRFMIVQFKENLLNHKHFKDKTIKKDFQKLLSKYLQKMIVNCNTSKMDARMIKNVDLSENDEILNELIEKGYAQDPNASVASKFNKSGTLKVSNSKKKNKTFDDIRGTETRKGADGTNYAVNIDDILLRQSKKGTKIFDVEDDTGKSKTPRSNRQSRADRTTLSHEQTKKKSLGQ